MESTVASTSTSPSPSTHSSLGGNVHVGAGETAEDKIFTRARLTRLNSLVTQLRKVANHPYRFPHVEVLAQY